VVGANSAYNIVKPHSKECRIIIVYKILVSRNYRKIQTPISGGLPLDKNNLKR